MPAVGGCPWPVLFIEVFGGLSLWPYMHISQLECRNRNIQNLPLLGSISSSCTVTGLLVGSGTDKN